MVNLVGIKSGWFLLVLSPLFEDSFPRFEGMARQFDSYVNITVLDISMFIHYD